MVEQDFKVSSYESIQNKLFHQNNLANDTKNFITETCESLKKEPQIKVNSNLLEKIELILDIIQSFTNHIHNPLSDEISEKLSEYQELLQLAHQEKIVLLNTIQNLKNNIKQHQNFINKKLESFKSLTKSNFSENSEQQENQINKLLEIQNKTDYLLQIIQKENPKNIIDSNVFLMNLEEKVEFIYKNYENEKKGNGNDKLILKNLKSALQIHQSCFLLIQKFKNSHPEKIILENKLQTLQKFLYDQLGQLIQKILNDLEAFYEKVKSLYNQLLMKDQYTLVNYFVPEDHEDEKMLNTFCIPKPINQILLSDIQQTFPLKGEYIFRFKTKFRKQSIFIDVIEEKEVLPDFEGKIIFKANRINWQQNNQERIHKKSQSVETGHVDLLENNDDIAFCQLINQNQNSFQKGRVLQGDILGDDEISMSNVIGIEDIQENIQKMNEYFEGYEKLIDSMKEEVSKKLIIIKERLQKPDLKMMGMHPGMNYPYTAYPMGGGNEDEENAEGKN